MTVAAAVTRAAPPPPGLFRNESPERVFNESHGCLSCHDFTPSPDAEAGVADRPDMLDSSTMHATSSVSLGCARCHGGDADVVRPPDVLPDSTSYKQLTSRAHVLPRHPERWPTSANPVRSYTALNQESPDFIRFINPGDLRVADRSCGETGCHPSEVARVRTSMMTHGGMLWGAALYNNGSFPLKNAHFGESYASDGTPQRLQTIPQPDEYETKLYGVLPFLNPLPRFEVTQPGNILRVFERGDDRLSPRGLGTINRTDPVFQGLQRTRLLDPILSFLGTNDHPGDYRSSGCTACHVVYANDRDSFHSGPYARYGNLGTTATDDPPIKERGGERGHPIHHVFTRGIPSSQCVVCHMHPGTSFANAYFGYTWWDNETHGEYLYPKREQHPSPEQELASFSANPEGSALRGLWSNLYPGERNHKGDVAGPDFLERTWELNPRLRLTKFADFHGHGWMFRAVFKHDRQGHLLDARDHVVEATPANTEQALTTPVDGRPDGGAGVPVHLKDIHLEKGMHCVDCHFEQDMHGTGKLYGEPRNAIEIECVDCHGTVRGLSTLHTSGPTAPPGGTDLSTKVTPFGAPLFEWQAGRLFQHSMVDPNVQWEVVQVLDSITPGNPHYSALSRLAKTIRRDGSTWGDVPADTPDVRAGGSNPPDWGTPPPRPTGAPSATLAHRDDDLACYTCHTSWMTSCFGCHLPMRANWRRPLLHYEGDYERNWTSYNYQVLRDDVFMLGRDGSVKRNRITPVRSSSAVLVGSQNLNREWLYSQQQTVSSEGYSGQAFNPHFPHTVRGGNDTKTCVDCHVSARGDNNAWMAQLLLQGTNFVNFLGRYVYVGEEDEGLEAVAVTEQDEPQAVIGSSLHAIAYPDRYAAHVARGRLLPGSLMYEHPAADVLTPPWRHERVQFLQLRGEYLYSANGPGGARVYDVADIDNKKNPERITTSVISPLGQRLYVRTSDAAAVISPSTLAVDPTRPHLGENEERTVHPLYGYLYILDREEGLVLTGAATLLDGNPDNNFLERARLTDGTTAFNPDGVLTGAVNGAIAGRYLYVCAARGLVVIDIDEPLAPHVVATVGASEGVGAPRAVGVQFRYAFVADARGLAVIDVTDPTQPAVRARLPIADARDVYVARTYAYVAGGPQGLVIVDVGQPEHPVIDQVYNAGGAINDTRAVRVGMTNASLFAYLADGRNGLRVVQLLSPEAPGYTGFSPQPRPDLPGLGLIATYGTKGPAIAISKGLDRDRAVDESGNQVAVFGRRGAGPLSLEDQRRLYMRQDASGEHPYTVPEFKDAADVRRAFPPPR